MKLSIEEPTSLLDGYFVFVPRVFVSIWSGMLDELSQRWPWASDDDYWRAYQIIARLRACMLSCPAEELIEGQNRLYRLIATAQFGTVWSVTSTEPLVIEPPIPDVPDMTPALPGQIAQSEDIRVKLQAIIDAIGEGDTDIADILAQLVEIGALLA